MHIPAKGTGKIGRLVQDISLQSYGIYLAHIMVLNVFYNLLQPLFPSALLSVPVIALCTFISVYLLVKLLSFLPKSKYWLG